jgi:hypothetical protein
MLRGIGLGLGLLFSAFALERLAGGDLVRNQGHRPYKKLKRDPWGAFSAAVGAVMNAKAFKLDPEKAEAQLADAERELRGLGHLPFMIEEERRAIELQFKPVYDKVTPAQIKAHHAYLEAKRRDEERDRPRRNGRVPSKYLGSLKGAKRTSRRREITSRAKESRKLGPRRPKSAFRPFKTDAGSKTRTSSYTAEFKRRYGDVKGGLPAIASASYEDVAPDATLAGYQRALKKVYNRGLAAWSTGHRPGATQGQWGFARVYSFIVGGKTRHAADADIAESIGLG